MQPPKLDEAAAAAAVVQRLRARLAKLEDLRTGVAHSLRQLDIEIEELIQVLGDARLWRPSDKLHVRTARRCQAMVRLLELNGTASAKDLHRWTGELIGLSEAGSYQTFKATLKNRPDLFMKAGRSAWTLSNPRKATPNEPVSADRVAAPGGQELERAPRGSLRGPGGVAESTPG